MNKGIGIIILGALAVIGGAAFAAYMIKKRLEKEADFDEDMFFTDDDFDSIFDNENEDGDLTHEGFFAEEKEEDDIATDLM